MTSVYLLELRETATSTALGHGCALPADSSRRTHRQASTLGSGRTTSMSTCGLALRVLSLCRLDTGLTRQVSLAAHFQEQSTRARQSIYYQASAF